MDLGQLRGVLEQLERAGQDHTQWRDGLARAVACRLSPDPRDLGKEAHRQCPFGAWYYSHPPAALRDHPSFIAMEVEHRRLHEIARRILQSTLDGAAVEPVDFDGFMSASERLRLELDSLRHELERLLANRDALTGAHRRLDLLPELRESLELVKRDVQICCIAFMDLDRFKPVNDTYGHRIGDQVLANAVSYLMEHLRPFDRLYRYGGDEFLISMPGADLATGRSIVERICKGLGTTVLARDGAAQVCMTASFGIAQLDPCLSVEEAIDNADRALLAAKATGRNRVCAWDPAATTVTISRAFRATDD